MPMPKALILAGDHYHVPEDAFTGVGEVILGEGLFVDYTDDQTALDAEMLADKDMLVILRDGIEFPDGTDKEPVRWMQPEQEQAIEQFVLNGGGFLALHNAGWNYPHEGGYRRTLAAYYIGHPPMAKFHVEVVNPEHPITQGVASYDITDEQHLLYFDYDRVEVLTVSKGQDGRQSVAGFAHDYGKGRVAYLGQGHTLDIIRHPMVQKLMRQATRWVLHRI